MVGLVQSERADLRLERARVQLPGLLRQPGARPQHGHSFTLLRRVYDRMPARNPPFLRLTGPARMCLDAHGGLGLSALAQAGKAVLRSLLRWRPGTTIRLKIRTVDIRICRPRSVQRAAAARTKSSRGRQYLPGKVCWPDRSDTGRRRGTHAIGDAARAELPTREPRAVLVGHLAGGQRRFVTVLMS